MRRFLLFIIVLMLVSCENTIYHAEDNIGPQFNEYTTFLDQYSEFTYIPSDDTVSAEVLDELCDSRLQYTGEYDNIVMVMDVPYLYNDKTGNLGCLCIDPLCFHNTPDCPYYGLISSVVFNNHKAYYHALDPAEGIYVYYELDLQNNRKRELRSRPMGAQVLSQYFDHDYAYYYDIIEEDDPIQKTVNRYYAFMRQNLKTLETEELSRTEGYIDTIIRHRFGDTFLFRRQSDGNLLIAPVDNLSAQTVIFDGFVSGKNNSMQIEGDTVFFLELTDAGAVLSSICYDGTGCRSYPIPELFDKIQSYYVTEKNIYYMGNEPLDIPSGGVTSFLCPRTIWRMDRETEEITLAYEMDERLDLVDIEQFIVKGNYIYAKYVLFTEDYQAIDDSEGCLRLGIADGSIYLIDWD